MANVTLDHLPSALISQISNIINVNPQDVMQDIKAKGLPVDTFDDLNTNIIIKNYRRIEDMSQSYCNYAARNSAVTGLASGFGGWSTMITIGGVDILNMAAQLYRLNQRVAYLNGFNPNNPHDSELTKEIYLYSLGFDRAAVASMQAIMTKAANIAGKKGANSNYILKFIIQVASILGVKLNTKQAAKYIPIVGGVLGGGINYTFAKKTATAIQKRYKEEFFRRVQTELINAKNSAE